MAGAADQIRLAAQHAAEGRAEQAKSLLRRIVQKDPGNAEACQRLGNLLVQAGEGPQAVFFLEKAASLAPHHPGPLIDLGRAHTRAGAHVKARAAFEKAVRVDPRSAGALTQLGQCLLNLDDPNGAAPILERAIAAAPEKVDARLVAARMHLMRCEHEAAVAQYRAAIGRAPDRPDLWSRYAGTLLDCDEATEREVFEAHREYGRILATALPPDGFAFGNPPDADRPVRVGFLSPDLYEHSVVSFLEPLLEHHDRTAFEFHVYAIASVRDRVTERLRSRVGHWCDASGMTETGLLERIRGDGIDILLELAGHSSRQPLTLLHQRGAPVQASFIGYPATTGVANIDYRIVDGITDPPESLAVERLWRVEPCFLCYRPPEDAPPVSSAPGGAGVTFGSFNAITKITRGTVALWSRVLGGVPGSRMVVKGQMLTSEAVRGTIRRMFEGCGVDASRVDLLGPLPSRAAHLAAYGRMDVALDTFPYNGTTTTCEALWMGVPVVTLAGRMHHSRVGASLLSAAGLGASVAEDADGFVRIARALASEAPARAGLRERVRGSPLCDGARYARTIEGALRGMWREWCAAKRLRSA